VLQVDFFADQHLGQPPQNQQVQFFQRFVRCLRIDGFGLQTARAAGRFTQLQRFAGNCRCVELDLQGFTAGGELGFLVLGMQLNRGFGDDHGALRGPLVGRLADWPGRLWSAAGSGLSSSVKITRLCPLSAGKPAIFSPAAENVSADAWVMLRRWPCRGMSLSV
jgi:hypothetical protein